MRDSPASLASRRKSFEVFILFFLGGGEGLTLLCESFALNKCIMYLLNGTRQSFSVFDLVVVG